MSRRFRTTSGTRWTSSPATGRHSASNTRPGSGGRSQPRYLLSRPFVSTVRDVANPGRRAALRDVGRRYLQGTYRLDRRALALLGGHTVAIDPWGVPIAWAYGLRWDPLPVLQNEAYTPRLDQLNADALSSGDGPERILRINTLRTEPGLSPTNALDGRYPAHDSPAARVAMLCH